MTRKMTQAPSLTPGQEFLLSLERERYNVAYRTTPPPQVVTREVIRTIQKPCKKAHPNPAEQEKRDQIMFNAGRFAAGATDKVAIEAHEALMELLGE